MGNPFQTTRRDSPFRRHGPGTDETQLSVSTGLRIAQVQIPLLYLPNFWVTDQDDSGSDLSNGIVTALDSPSEDGQLSVDGSGNARIYQDTGGFWMNLPTVWGQASGTSGLGTSPQQHIGQRLPWGYTPCIRLSSGGTGTLGTTARSIQFRVTGRNLLGEVVRETTPPLSFPLAADVTGTADGADITAYTWMVNTFQEIEKIEYKSDSLSATADDRVAMGLVHPLFVNNDMLGLSSGDLQAGHYGPPAPNCTEGNVVILNAQAAAGSDASNPDYTALRADNFNWGVEIPHFVQGGHDVAWDGLGNKKSALAEDARYEFLGGTLQNISRLVTVIDDSDTGASSTNSSLEMFFVGAADITKSIVDSANLAPALATPVGGALINTGGAFSGWQRNNGRKLHLVQVNSQATNNLLTLAPYRRVLSTSPNTDGTPTAGELQTLIQNNFQWDFHWMLTATFRCNVNDPFYRSKLPQKGVI